MSLSLSLGLGGTGGFAPGLNAYWGQAGGHSLREVCDSGVQYATVSFINNSPEHGHGYPGSNFGANCGGEYYTKDGKLTKLLSSCTAIQRDIPYCQSKGVKVLLAIGGQAMPGSSEYDVSSVDEGIHFAEFLYNAFGPYNSSWDGPRPFDQGPGQEVSVDGFDLDLEDSSGQFSNEPYIAMVEWWRKQSKKMIITAAPQCVISSPWFKNKNDELIARAEFDALFIQFYNNPVCDAIPNNTDGDKFSFDAWADKVAKGKSANAKLFIGLPASKESAGSGYIDSEALKKLVCEYSSRKNFGGVSLWDATRAMDNPVGQGKDFLQSAAEHVKYLCKEPPVTTSSVSTSTKPTSTTVSSASSVKSTVSSASIKTTTSSASSVKSTTSSASSVKSTVSSASSVKSTTSSASSVKSTVSSASSVKSTTSSASSVKSTVSSASSVKSTTSSASSVKSTVSSASSVKSTTSSASSVKSTVSSASSKTTTTSASIESTVSSASIKTTTTSASIKTTTTSASIKTTTTSASIESTVGSASSAKSTAINSTSSIKPTTGRPDSQKPSSISWSNSTTTETLQTTSKPVSMTTSTVYTTSVHTVTECPPTVTDCEINHVTTETIALYTTVCPVTETAHPPKPTTTKAPVMTTSTVYTTKTYTITKCPPAVTDCPVGHVTTETVALYTTVCPAGEAETVKVPKPTGSAPPAGSAPLTVATQTTTFTKTVKVQKPSSTQTLIRSSAGAPQPSGNDCTGPSCPGASNAPGSGCTGAQCPGVAIPTNSWTNKHVDGTGCTGPECPGVALPTNSWSGSPVRPSVVPSSPVTAGASTLALGLTGLVAIVAAQVMAM